MRRGGGSSTRPGQALRVVGTIVLATVGGLAQEQYPIFTIDHLDRTMQTVGPNVAAARASVDDRDFEGAKAQLVRAREQLATTVTFWRDHERDDAVGFLRATLGAMDAVDDALSAETLDRSVMTERMQAVDRACEACHTAYREQDPETGAYRVGNMPNTEENVREE